jgi:hypothetical protein
MGGDEAQGDGTMSARLTLRARQILSDPTLPDRQRITNADSLLTTLRNSIADGSVSLNDVLTDIDDPEVKRSMLKALS